MESNIEEHGDEHCDACGDNQYQLAWPAQGIDAVDADDDGEKSDEEDDRCQRQQVFHIAMHIRLNCGYLKVFLVWRANSSRLFGKW